MKEKICVLLLAACCVLLASCADTKPPGGSRDQISNIPWNRPEKWEGEGMMGGMGTR